MIVTVSAVVSAASLLILAVMLTVFFLTPQNDSLCRTVHRPDGPVVVIDLSGEMQEEVQNKNE